MKFTVLFYILFNVVNANINKQGIFRHETVETLIERVCADNSGVSIKAATQAFGKLYVFADKYVAELHQFSELDYKMGIPFRISIGFPKETKTVFPMENITLENVTYATFSDNGNIMLREDSSKKWFNFSKKQLNFSLGSFSPTARLIKQFKQFKAQVKNTTNGRFRTVGKLISRFRNSNADFIHVVICVGIFETGNISRCFDYVAINDTVETKEINVIDGIEAKNIVEFAYSAQQELHKQTVYLIRMDKNNNDNFTFWEKELNNRTIIETLSRGTPFAANLLLGCPPKFCQSTFIDALLRNDAAKADVITGVWYFNWNFNKKPEGRSLVKDKWCNIAAHSDAAFSFEGESEYYFIKEDKLYTCENGEDNSKGLLATNFPRINKRIDAAVHVREEERGKSGFNYFFSGMTVFKYPSAGGALLNKTNLATFVIGLDNFVIAAMTGVIKDSEKMILVQQELMYIIDISTLKESENTAEIVPIKTYMGCISSSTTALPTSVTLVTSKGPLPVTVTTMAVPTTLGYTGTETSKRDKTLFITMIVLVIVFFHCLVLGIILRICIRQSNGGSEIIAPTLQSLPQKGAKSRRKEKTNERNKELAKKLVEVKTKSKSVKVNPTFSEMFASRTKRSKSAPRKGARTKNVFQGRKRKRKT